MKVEFALPVVPRNGQRHETPEDEVCHHHGCETANAGGVALCGVADITCEERHAKSLILELLLLNKLN